MYYSPLFFKPEHRVYLKPISVECISLSQFENEEVETASHDGPSFLPSVCGQKVRLWLMPRPAAALPVLSFHCSTLALICCMILERLEGLAEPQSSNL